ncbi:MAG: hypothetical protein GX621_12620 [Pirellulaceae bacterium]|nr:hypothetical protein [Pirellulaceae bacterium]
MRDGGAAISIRTKAGTEFITGSATGIAATATGAGLAAAGGTAAASIAAANAAALSATTTVAAPSVVSSLLSAFPMTQWLAPVATGTATVAAPGAIAATPLWVALAGPVGWTLAGIGILAVPFSWRLSKLRLKDKLETVSREQVDKVFISLRDNRLPALRSMGKAICEEFQIRLDQQLGQIENAIMAALEFRKKGAVEEDVEALTARARRLRTLIDQPPEFAERQR